MNTRLQQAFDETVVQEEVRQMLTEDELKRTKDLLSTVECSLTELKDIAGFKKLLGSAELGRFRGFAYQVAAWKLALPPAGFKL